MAGGADFWSIPAQVGCKPSQTHLGSFLSLLGCIRATCYRSGLTLSARSLLLCLPCHCCRAKSLRNMLGYICHQPGPLQLCIHPSYSICSSPYLQLRVCRQKQCSQGSGIREGSAEEWDGAGSIKLSSFSLCAPWLWGQRELITAG